MLTSLSGRSVVVTGASKGIGKGIARVFANSGAKVLLVSRHRDEAEACAEELRQAGGTAKGYAADITQLAGMTAMADFAATAFGGIDVLCANAGIFPQAKIEDMSPEDWDHVVSTNLKGTFLPVKACLPYLKKSDQGRIVLTSSITGPVTGFPGWSHYGATKAGQLGFMRRPHNFFAPGRRKRTNFLPPKFFFKIGIHNADFLTANLRSSSLILLAGISAD